MSRWGREFRFLTVSALVVLSLTGFSTGSHSSSGGSSGGSKVSKSKSGSSRSGKSSSRHSSGGGGCSSSHQDHDAYDDDDDDDTYAGDTSAGDDSYADDSAADATATPQQGAIVKLVSCATRKQPYATVELRNPNAQDGTFEVRISFLDAKGKLVDSEVDHVEVPAGGTTATKEYVVGNAAAVRRCKVGELADPVTSTP
ncbi:hypothetical protein [Streptomyces sp. NPDC014006]|uniref:hypothetical protein n=1 Tax=Streptomyces sp. NPDC014006 TaxID=3364870 RepID=UPI0036F7447A